MLLCVFMHFFITFLRSCLRQLLDVFVVVNKAMELGNVTPPLQKISERARTFSPILHITSAKKHSGKHPIANPPSEIEEAAVKQLPEQAIAGHGCVTLAWRRFGRAGWSKCSERCRGEGSDEATPAKSHLISRARVAPGAPTCWWRRCE